MKLSLPEGSQLLQPQFVYGTATASFQIEGDRAGRQACIWDTFCAEPGNIVDGTNGDVACEHVRLWREDLALLKSLKIDAYRFSISWPRVMDENGKLNLQGVQFYISLLDALNDAGIKPFVTLYHWDLPQYLEDQGGWLNRETAYAFRDYVAAITEAFGQRVYSYATLNEPFCSAYLGYEWGVHAPGKTGKDKGKKAAHHLLLAHGLAMEILNKNSPSSLNGIVLNFSPCYAATDSPADQAAARLADDHLNQWFIKPLIDGQYPELLQRLPEEHRPDILAGDLAIISQPMDFMGVNYYTRHIYRHCDQQGFQAVTPQGVETTAMGWEVYPQGFTDLLVDLHQRYRLPPLYITENGAATDDQVNAQGEVEDIQRMAYLQSHLLAVHNAVEQGVNIDGYFVWSLMDNFEWAEGYAKRFGIIYVDYPTQQRTKKASAKAYTDLISRRCQ